MYNLVRNMWIREAITEDQIYALVDKRLLTESQAIEIMEEKR